MSGPRRGLRPQPSPLRGTMAAAVAAAFLALVCARPRAIAAPAPPGATPAAPARDLLVRDVRVIDATGAAPRDGLDVLVRDGRIAAIAPGVAAPPGAAVLDGRGATLLPGLIDAHVHFISAPGSQRRGDTPATIARLNRQHLRAYLACGVTTVLDAGIDETTARDLRAALAGGTPGPRVLVLGPMLTTPGSYPGNDRWGPVSSPAGVAAFLDRVQSVGGVGVKVPIEHGGGGLAIVPPDIREAVVREAAARGLPLYVHATSADDQALALDMHPRALMHVAMSGRWVNRDQWGTGELPGALVERMRRDGTYQVTTLALIASWPTTFTSAVLDDPLVRLTVPSLELDTARQPDIVAWTSRELVGWVVPWLPRFARGLVAGWVWSEGALRDGLARSERVVRQLHAAGVPIVAGSDTPSPWPLSIHLFHGVSSVREVELLEEAGLPPLDAIRAATAIPARMLDLAAEVGTVEVGKRADLVVVDGDPSQGARALRSVRWTIRDGVARTPADWMATGAGR